ncbi:MAG: type II secretion system protein [Phycisphaerae bacterium]|nr:type II secretion system protein [Phycisphaerae bacterium]
MERTRGFTLVEILIVVVLLGILAAIVIPTVSQGATAARDSALASNLHLLRRFTLIYAAQHQEAMPGYTAEGVADPEAFRAQATMASTVTGETAVPGTPGYDRGPYMLKLPVNPLSKKDTIQIVEEFEAGDGSDGWQYKPVTGEVQADYEGYEDY